MKRFKEVIFIGMISLLIFSGMAYGSILLTVEPETAPAKTSGITFHTQASAPGGAVQFDLFSDSNNSGIIDGSEWAFITEIIVDNSAGDSDDIMTGDNNPSSPDISVFLNINNGIFPDGDYIIRVQNALGESATAQFTLTPVSEAQTVTGKIYEQGTTTPVPEAVVYCFDFATNAFISADFTDSNGNYTLQIPAPIDIEIGTFKFGYIDPEQSSLTVTSAGVSNYNMYLIPANAWITGIVTEYGTGNPVWGAEVHAKTIDGKGNNVISAINGTYTLPVLAGMEWVVHAHNDLPGYFDMLIPANNYEDDIIIIPTVAGPNIVDFAAYKETAWIEGTVLDEYGSQVVEGVLFYSNRTNTSEPAFQRLSNGHYTNASGQVTLGVMAGDWRVGLCMNCHEHPVRVNGIEREMVPPSEKDVLNLTTGEHRVVTLQAYYADGAIEGRVFREDCVTPAPSEVRVKVWTDNALNGSSPLSVGYINTQAETDEDGFYRLPLLGGTWTVRAEMWDWNKQSEEEIITLNTDGNDEIDQPGETITGVDLCLNLPTVLSVTKAHSFTETSANHPGGRPDGWYLHLRADVYDPSGVPDNIQSVEAFNLNVDIDSNTYNLNHSFGSTYKIHPDYNSQSGTYRFTVTNNQWQTAELDATPIDNPRQLAVILNLAVSDNSTTPTFAFDPVVNAGKYRLSIFDSSLLKIYQSDKFDTPSFVVPAGVMIVGNTYYLRAEAHDINSGDSDGVDDLENRSLNYLTFTPGEIGSLSSPYDTDQDWVIGDFELLNAIDDWADDKLGDFELLDLIDFWAFGSYCWDGDTLTDSYKAGVPDVSGACIE